MSDLPFYQIELEEDLSRNPQCFSSFNMLFLLQGTATARTNEQLIHLIPHDFVFFNSYEMHQFLTLSPDAKVLILLVSERYIQTAVPELLPLTLHTHAVTKDAEPERYGFFCREFGKMIYHHTVHSPGSQLQTLTHIGNLLSYVLNHLANPASGATSRNRDDRLFHALSYISEHYTEDLSLPEVAEQAGLHPQYFSRYFREHMGLTLTEYINQLRIVNSLSLVMSSSQSLLDIALASGFNSYKTYNTAFKKLFHLTPYAWQKEQVQIRDTQQTIDESSSTFSFFRDFWSEEPAKNMTENTVEENRITLELNTQTKGNPPSRCHLPEFCYSIGRAADLLRGDIQQQIRNVAEELPIHHLRLRNVFSDDLFVYYETPDKIPVYNWQYIDMVYDFLMELHIKPYTELGFMPRILASRQQFANWQHRPNVSFPRSLKNWSRLVENFLQHLIQRYGETEVLSWRFNMWTSADLGMKGGYWHESMENFFLFYRVTYNAVKNVQESLKFGGPDFSLPNGLSWYQAFFDYCRQYELRPDFLTVHIPALMLSAKGEEYDKLQGFELGIDDYVVKPFSIKELMARVKVILMRHEPKEEKAQSESYEFDGLTVNISAREVLVDGKRIELRPKEYDLLFFLVRNRGIVFSREALLEKVWGFDFMGDDRTVDAQIKMLRHALGDYRKYIVTYRGAGYKFEAEEKKA